MHMRINGRIEAIRDKFESCFILTMERENAALFLAYLDGLELQRISAFRVSSDTGFALLSGTAEVACHLECCEVSIDLVFTPNQIELIKCCCLDALFNFYPNPHIDLNNKDVSVCIAFE